MLADHVRNDVSGRWLRAVAMSSESGVQLGTPGKGSSLYGQALGTANSVGGMDITVDKQHALPARRHRRVPWSPRAWGQALYLAAGIPAQLIAALILFAVVRWSEVMDPRGIARLGLLWLACVVVIFLLSPVLTQVHRHRLRVTAGVEIPPQPKRGLLTWRGLEAVLRSQATWRQLCYHVLVAPVLAVAAAGAGG